MRSRGDNISIEIHQVQKSSVLGEGVCEVTILINDVRELPVLHHRVDDISVGIYQVGELAIPRERKLSVEEPRDVESDGENTPPQF